MPHLIFKGITREDAAFLQETLPLPPGAVRLRIPDRAMSKSMLLALPLAALCFAALGLKTALCAQFPFLKPWMPVGIVAGVLCCFVHEWLHGILQPPDADVYIGFIPRRFIFYMKCKEPLSKKRFIAMSLLPMLLGVLPLLLFLFTPVTHKVFLSIVWPMAMIGLLSPSPDYLNVLHVLREVPPDGFILDGEDGLYWYTR